MAFERGYQFNFHIINRVDLSDTKVSLLCLDANVFVIVIALAVFKSESNKSMGSDSIDCWTFSGIKGADPLLYSLQMVV